MKRPRLLISGLLAVLLLPVVGAFVAGFIGSARILSPPRRALQGYHHQILDDPAGYGLKIQPYTGPGDTPCLYVTAAAEPGEAKTGRLLRAELERNRLSLPPWDSPDGTIVLLHGYGSRKEDHLPVCVRFCAAGFRCIIPDLPAQGENPALQDTFGKNEAPMVAALVADAAPRFNFPAKAPTFLFGISQGGAIALRTAALYPGQWAGIATVAAFGSLDAPIKASLRHSLPRLARPFSPLIYAGINAGIRYRAGFWADDLRPVDLAGRIHIPAFVAHGDRDETVPPGEARRIFAALPESNKGYRMVPGADHDTILDDNATGLYTDLCTFYLRTLSSLHPAETRTE